ncbi:MAG: amino acid ABC transporter permease [Candidatus Methylomirabilales bacterium]
MAVTGQPDSQLDRLESPAERRLARSAGMILGVGIASIGLALGGTLVSTLANGIVPYGRLVEGLLSAPTAVILDLGLALGAVAIALGFATYRRMPTKRSREQSIAGAVLGIQALVVGLIIVVFRTFGDPDLFIRLFFKAGILEGHRGACVRGALNTIILAVTGEVGGIIVGLLLAMLAMSKRAVVRAPARVYINFFRGTPLIWQLSVFYFGFSIGLGIRPAIDVGPIQLSAAYTIAVIVFILNTGAYAAEVFRAGIQSIERGQLEAARSLGMSYPQAMRYAVVPQAVRRVIPPLMNEFVILIKDTSLVLVLGLAVGELELYTTAREGYSDTFNASFFTAAAIGYLAITLPSIWAVNRLERRLRSGLVGVGA